MAKEVFRLVDIEFNKYECELCGKETEWRQEWRDEDGNVETFDYYMSCALKLFRIAKEVARLWKEKS